MVLYNILLKIANGYFAVLSIFFRLANKQFMTRGVRLGRDPARGVWLVPVLEGESAG